MCIRDRIVDDAAFMRMMIKNALSGAGYSNLLEAGDGKIAVDMYQSCLLYTSKMLKVR